MRCGLKKMKNIEPFIEKVSLLKEIKANKKKFKNFVRVSIFFEILTMIFLLLVVNWHSYYESPEIDYSRLDNETKIYAKSLIDEVRWEYLYTAKKITFTTDIKYIYKGNDWNNSYVNVGVNRVPVKKIKVYLSGYKEEDKIVLCHELLHNFVINGKDEFFIQDLTSKGVCYEDGD